MHPTLTMVSTVSSMISIPHLATVTIPYTALFWHAISFSIPSTDHSTPHALPHIILSQEGAPDDESFVDDESAQALASECAQIEASLAARLSNALQSWRSLVTLHIDTLAEAQDMQVEDDVEETDWYYHNTPSLRKRSSSRACGSPCTSSHRLSTRRASNSSSHSSRRRSCSKTASPEELGKRLISLEANAPRTCVLLAAPSSHGRRAAA